MEGNYPRSWDEYVGQERAKRQLRMTAREAYIRKAAAEHVIITGGAGMGKTALARQFGREMSRPVHEVSGAVRMADARCKLMDMNDGDVLFYDEIHKVVDGGKRNAEWLLHLLIDGVMMTPLGPEPVPDITLVGATTDQGKLPETILSRFAIKAQLVEYSDAEAAQVAALMAPKVFGTDAPLPSTANLAALALAGNNNPRDIESLLISLRIMAITEEITRRRGEYALDELFDVQQITPDGLNHDMQEYLRVLRKEFSGLASEKTLMQRLGHPGGLAPIETVLMTKRYMRRTPQGRMLTPEGMMRAKELLSQEAAA